MPSILLLRRRFFTVIVIYTPSLPIISQIDEICNSFERNFYKIVVKNRKITVFSRDLVEKYLTKIDVISEIYRMR